MEREEHCKQILLACVGSVHSVRTTLGLPKLKVACVSWVYTAQAPGCSAGVLSKAGLPFRALLRSKLLRFLGIPQGHRLIWVCVLCLSQVKAAQATRYLVSTLSQVGHAFNHLPQSQLLFPECAMKAPSQVCCVSPLGSQSQAAMTSPSLLGDVNRPESQEYMVTN